MPQYRTSGAFGEVKIFETCIPSHKLSSLDGIDSIGWHRVGSLYKMHRPAGAPVGLLLFTLGGGGRVCVEDAEYTVEAGDVAVLPAHVAHLYQPASGREWEFYWLHFFGDTADSAVRDLVADGLHLIRLKVSDILRVFGDYLAFSARGLERELDNSDWIRRVFAMLLRKKYAEEQRSDEHGIVRRMLDLLDRDGEERLSLDVLAETCHYSKEYLIRCFKRSVGISPYRYWILRRLQRSCIALREGNATVEQIALDFGYRSVSNYSNLFRKHYHMSPSEYRRLNQFGKN